MTRLQRQDQSSKRSRAHEMGDRNLQRKKSGRKDFGDNLLSRACVNSTASAAHMATNTLIMTLDISSRSRHQVDQAEDMLLCSYCKALAHTYFANWIGRAVRKVFLRKAREHYGKDAVAHCMLTQAATTAHKNQQSGGCPRNEVGLQKPHGSAEMQRAAVLSPMT